MLDPKIALNRQANFIDAEIKKLSVRVRESRLAHELSQKLLEKGASEHEVTARIQELYPYQLNNQKPFAELFAELPKEVRRWEFEHGFRKRSTQLFAPQMRNLEAHRQALDDLQST